MSRAEAMLSYVPLYYRSSDILKAVLEVEGEEADRLRQAIAEFQDQFSVDKATWGLDLWEKNYALPADPNLTLDERRARIKGKQRGTGTVGAPLIQSVAEAYANGKVEIAFNDAVIVRFVDINGIPSNIDDLKQQVGNVIPAHLPLFFRYKYLFIAEMDRIRIAELETMTLNDFEDYQ